MIRSFILLVSLVFILNSFASDINFDSRQWSVSNTAQSYNRKNSELTYNTINGIEGVDINDLTKVQRQSLGANKAIVAIIDSGVDIHHPDLKDKIWEFPDCIGKSEEERKSLPCFGINVLDNNGDVSDKDGHGTFVAGLIAAKRDGIGISGVLTENVKIMPIKAITNFKGFTYNGKVVTSYIARGIIFAVNNGASVINLSLGIPKVVETPQVVSAIDYALSKNVIVVASAGNNNKRKNIFPCNYNGVVCVGGIDIQGEKVSSSNYGQTVDIYAPGEKLISTIPVGMESTILRIGNYDVKNGTSFAISYISALAAALKIKGSIKNSYDFLSILETSNRNFSKDEILPAVDYQKAFNVNQLRPVILTKKIDKIAIEKKNDKFFASFELEIYHPNFENEILDDHICINSKQSVLRDDIELCKKIKLSNKLNKVNLQYELKDLDIDSWQEFEINLVKSSVLKSIDVELLAPVKVSKKKVVSKIAAGAILRIASNIKVSQLKKVIDYNATKETQDYYALNTRSKRSIFYMKEVDNEYLPSQIIFEEDINVISLMKVDMNLDGKLDLFVYGTSKDNREYIMASYSMDGRPLFGKNSIWHLQASQFGALDFNRGRAYFNFIRSNSKDLGDFLTPLVSRVFELPQVDNNTDPIDYLENKVKKRPYYLMPSVIDGKVRLQIRTIESYSFDEKFRNLLDLDYFKSIQFISYTEQDRLSMNSGRSKLIFAVGEVNYNQYYELEFTNTKDFTIKRKGRALQLHKSDIATVRSTRDGDFTDEFMITRQQERNKLAFKFSHLRRTLRFESDWEDPLASILGVFKEGNSYSIYIEGRYNIHLLKTDGNTILSHSVTSINRESSFPGGNFSQLFQLGQLNSTTGLIYSDMQMLFGDSIHLLTSTDGLISKKLKYNLAIPNDCALLGHSQIKFEQEVRLHCLGPGKLTSVHSIKVD